MADPDRRGPVLRILAFFDGLLTFWERLWTLVVFGGLFAFAVVMLVLHYVRKD